jgi:hypothetical protein
MKHICKLLKFVSLRSFCNDSIFVIQPKQNYTSLKPFMQRFSNSVILTSPPPHSQHLKLSLYQNNSGSFARIGVCKTELLPSKAPIRSLCACNSILNAVFRTVAPIAAGRDPPKWLLFAVPEAVIHVTWTFMNRQEKTLVLVMQ